MPNPWEKYAAQPQQESGPWAKYASTATDHPAADAEKPGFFSSLWDTVKKGPANLLGFGNEINHLVTHPKEILPTISGMGQQTIDLGKGAAQEFGKGNFIGGARKTVNAGLNFAVPGLGAQSEDAGQEFDKGNTAAGFGKTLGVGLNTAAGIAGPKAAVAVAKNPGMLKPSNLARLDPEIATDRVFRPTEADNEFPEVAHTAWSDLKAEGGPVTSNKELIPAARTAVSNIQQKYLEPYLEAARQRGQQVQGDSIVAATRDSIPKLMWTKDPQGAQAIMDRAQATWGGKAFSTDDFRDFLKTGNTNRFYNQTATAQGSAAIGGTPPAIDAAETAGIRNGLYKALDYEGEGAGPRSIQERTGNLIDMGNQGERIQGRVRREQPMSTLGKIGKIAAIPAEAASLPFRSNPMPIIPRIMHPLSGPTNALIRTLYDQAPEASPFPQPAPFQPRALLNRGPLVTPAPADTSYVRGAGLAPHQAVNAERLMLPQGRAPFTQGVSVPDVMGKPGQGQPYNAGLLEAPQPGQPPTNVLPRGPASNQLPSYMPSSAGHPRPLGPLTPEELAKLRASQK